ncbi:MAG: nitrous oxide reductase accessory protein NosL [Campylobacter sp.]|nr:nitrous oxide reductase accessory protein NosL [Campylobacter sp.]
MKISKFLVSLFATSMLLFGAEAIDFNKSASGDVQIHQHGDGKEFCPVCGMKIQNYYKTSHASHLDDGTKTHYCSMRCLIVDSYERKADLENAMVVDANSQKLIPAKSAFYVVGSSVNGTMAKVSKLAFENENDAKEFAKIYGGEIKNYQDTLEIAKEAIKTDNAERKMRMQKMVYPMGEKVYKSKCKEINLSEFDSVRALKAEIYAKCENITEKEAQPVLRYLWDRQKHAHGEKIVVKESDKCPVCGMFVHKHKEWAAKISFENGEYAAFDGVKDMMKFIFEPAKYGFKDAKIAKIQVSDYYAQNAIDAKSAFFVVGSDVLGPMGNELIPFGDEDSAKSFKLDHRGEAILKFDEINKQIVCRLDGGSCE